MVIHENKLYEEAEYKEQELYEFKGNPLIEALPPVFREFEIMDHVAYLPYHSDDERQLPKEVRSQCVQRLANYVEPLSIYFDLEQRFSRVIRHGYVARNPMKPLYASRLRKGYNLISSGKYPFTADLDTRSKTAGFSIIGYSGVGKTTAIERILSMYPQVILHSRYQGKNLSLFQVVYVKLDCPFDGSLKGLCINFFQEIDRLIGTDYFKKFGSTRNTVDMMIAVMSQVASVHCVGILIIDEIQHLSFAKSGGSDKMLNFFVTLTNTIGIPVVLVGTPKAMGVLQGDFRQARRGTGQGDLFWDRMKNDDLWEYVMEGMWKYQWTKLPTDLNSDIIDTFYDESQGIIDIAVKLYACVQWEAMMKGGNERITPELIGKTAKKRLNLVMPMLAALRSGDMKKLAMYEDIRPIDLKEYYTEVQDNFKSVQKLNFNRGTISAFNIQEEIVSSLSNIGIDPGRADEIAKIVITNNKKSNDTSLMLRQAMKMALSLEDSQEDLSGTTQNRKNKTKDKTSGKPPQKDFSSAVDLGRKKSKTAYQSLNEAGYIKDPLQELF